MRKQRLFVDMDGTLNVFRQVSAIEELYAEGFFLNSLPHLHVVQAVQTIIQNNPEIDVFVLSSTLSDSKYAQQEKNAWLDQYLPTIPKERRLFPPYGMDKQNAIPGGLLSTDFLLDDYTHNLHLWQLVGRGIKLLNGINHTRGSWQYDRLRYDKPSDELAANIVSIMRGGQRIMDDAPPCSRMSASIVELDMEAISMQLERVFASLTRYEKYLRFCDLASTSNLDANNLALVLAANPHAREVGSLSYWNQRYQCIKLHAKGIPIMRHDNQYTSTGYVFDVSQIQPNSFAAGRDQQGYQKRYPFSGDQTEGFFQLWPQAIQQVRIVRDTETSEKSQLRGAVIYINASLPVIDQTSEVLRQYYRYIMGKTIAEQPRNNNRKNMVESSAATFAYILGKKLGFTMPKPHQLVDPSETFSCQFPDMQVMLSQIVSSVTRTHGLLGKTANRVFEQAQEKSRRM